MKKFSYLLITIAIHLSCSFTVFSQNVVSLPEIILQETNSGVFGISLANVDELASGQIEIIYNSTQGLIIEGATLIGRASSHIKSVNIDNTDPTNTKVTIMFYSMSGDVITVGNDEFIELSYSTTIGSSTPSPLTISNLLLSDISANALSSTEEHGSFIFEAPVVLGISAQDVSQYPDSIAIVDISVDNPTNELIEGVIITVSYDIALTLGSSAFINDALNFPNSSYNFLTNTSQPGKIVIVAAYNGVGLPFSSTSGLFGNVQLKIPASAITGTVYDLNFVSNTQINEIPVIDVTLNNGSITVLQNTFSIQGDVVTHTNIPVSNVALTLNGETETITTTSNPNYIFSDLLIGNWTMSADKSDELNGVSAYDASIVMQYLIGNITLNAYQMISVDPTGDGTVSPLDVSQILQYVAGLITSFDSARDWVLVTGSLPGEYSGSTTVPSFNEVKSFTPLTADILSEQWVAVRIGDVTGNWSSVARDNNRIYQAVTVQEGELIKMHVISNQFITFEGIDAEIEENSYLELINSYPSGVLLTENLNFINYDNKMAIALETPVYNKGKFMTYEYRAISSGEALISFNTLQVNEQNIDYTMEFEKTTGDDNIETTDRFRVYPSPAISSINVEGFSKKSNNQNELIEIYDLEGRIVKQVSTQNQEKVNIDIRNLSIGQYFVVKGSQRRQYPIKCVKLISESAFFIA